MTDLHLHSQYSWDIEPGAGSSCDLICKTAIERGIKYAAVTDHYDIDAILDGFFPPLDTEGVRRDIFAAKEKYAGKLNLLYGIELGQAIHKREESEEFLEKYNFDFVIGSLHAVRGIIDFYNVEYDKKTDAELSKLLDMYIDEMYELIDWGKFSTLAHITYPFRYYYRNKKDYLVWSIEEQIDRFSGIFREIIKKGIPLEVNTSGIRQGMNGPLPNFELVKEYYNLGGRLLTVGSDAHFQKDIGADIPFVLSKLKEIGFESVCTYENGKPVPVKI